ncbi:MAG: hypothetical protein AB9907_13045 [Flexilinea sp.]
MTKKKSKNSLKSETPRQDAFDDAWEKFKPLIPESELSALEASFSKPLDRSFRINPLKITPDDLDLLQKRYGWELEPVPFCPEGFRVRKFETSPSQTIEHRNGQFYIQDTASMLPGVLFSSELMESRPLILDMAASPGGKTTHLVTRSKDMGLICANDSSLSRIGALKTVLKNWGGINHFITNFPGESFGAWYPDTFDLVLLDAPCSMQSLVSIDSHPMRPITGREEKALAQRQTALLDSALNALKPGGQAVYSTCTLSADEDEAVVNRMLEKYGTKISIENAQELIPYPAPGVVKNGLQIFDPSLAGTVRLWPHRYETAGFFAALIRKNDSFGGKILETPVRAWEKSGFEKINKEMGQEIKKWFESQFNFSLEAVLLETDCSLWQRMTEVWALPNRYLTDFSALPCKSAGMRIAALTASGWIPDHDWICRFFKHLLENRFLLDANQAISWQRGEDLHISTANQPKGTILLMTDEYETFLGCGRVSGERIRNLSR